MGKYIDSNYHCYNSISECLEHKQSSSFELKQLLRQKPKLLIIDKITGNILKTINEIQPLYLYPLSILDYCKTLLKKENSLFNKMISINIINFDPNINYIDKLKKLDLSQLSNIEIEINEKYNSLELNKIIDLINYFSINSIKITLLFKTINIEDKLLTKLSSLCDFFKIMMPNILNTPYFKEFNKKLNVITINKKDTSVILIKSYLAVDQNGHYEEAIKAFNKLNIDVFQLSKELMPLEKLDNPLIAQDIQDNIRWLEKEYSTSSKTKFVSVKDITTLYYPRFELDERNSHKCYAYNMKPYLHKDKFLPCRVNKVITNIEDCYVANLDSKINERSISKCGVSCDDCASIFENDILNEIEETLKNYKEENIEFVLEME